MFAHQRILQISSLENLDFSGTRSDMSGGLECADLVRQTELWLMSVSDRIPIGI